MICLRLLRAAPLLLLLSACAGTPSNNVPAVRAPADNALVVSDLSSLSGEWKGTWTEGAWTGPMTLMIFGGDEEAEFEFQTPTGVARNVARLVLSNGGLVLQGSAGHTTLRLYRRDGRDALSGEYQHSTGQTGTVQLWRQ
jgi:hypothetical protein